MSPSPFLIGPCLPATCARLALAAPPHPQAGKPDRAQVGAAPGRMKPLRLHRPLRKRLLRPHKPKHSGKSSHKYKRAAPRLDQKHIIGAPAAPPSRDEAVSGFNGPYAGATARFSAQHGANPSGRLSRFHAYPSVPATVAAGFLGFSGYNYPVHEIVIGSEIDAGGFSPYGALVASTSLRVRLGVVLGDGVLLYATGGGALGHFAASSGGQGALEAGWIAGAGFEAMIAPDVSWRVEFLHSAPVASDRAANIVRTGFAVHF